MHPRAGPKYQALEVALSGQTLVEFPCHNESAYCARPYSREDYFLSLMGHPCDFMDGFSRLLSERSPNRHYQFVFPVKPIYLAGTEADQSRYIGHFLFSICVPVELSFAILVAKKMS